MLWVGTLLGVGLAAAGYGAWWLLSVRRMPLANWVGVVALALWLVGVSIAWLAGERPRSADSVASTQSGASLAWPGTTPSPPASQSQPAVGAGVQAPPVQSLVAGLEARLAERPNDGEGWALLAQSYAYTSNEEAVERAVRRAVELGVDEQMLRDRVASAQRQAPPFDWVDEALRSGRLR